MTDIQRAVFLVALFGVLSASVTVGTVAGQSAPDCSNVFYNGDGSELNPNEVSNVDQLQCIKDEGLDKNYIQVSDIDASGTSSWNNGSGFDPIGDLSAFEIGTPFTGTFDGQGYNITDLSIERDSGNRVGVFGVVNNGEITNVSVVNASVIAQGIVGSLIGFARRESTVSGSYATGNVSGGGVVGGLVGGNRGTVTESYATASVNGPSRLGGLVGRNGGTITNSYATGSVSGDGRIQTRAGGLVGRNTGMISNSNSSASVEGNESLGGLVGLNEGTVNKSYSSGSVDGEDLVGGLVGNNLDGSTVSESYAIGSVSGSFRIGGLVGRNNGTVEKSYARGSVDGFEEVGGLVGGNRAGSAVSESYATGSVNGSFDVGGLIGLNAAPVIDSYWDTESTGQPTSDGGTGLTTSEMTGTAATSNMQGFDFTNTWVAVTNPDDYPILVWQEESALFPQPLPGFDNPPANTGELDPNLYEDVNGDGDGLDPSEAVLLWSELVQNPQEFNDLTEKQIDALDWNDDGNLSPADAVMLWSEKVQASTNS
jgi:hypothetical protein